MTSDAIRKRKLKVHFRKHKFFYKASVALVLAVIIFIVSMYATVKQVAEVKKFASPTSSPKAAPTWIKLPNGAEFRSDICTQFETFSTIEGEGKDEVEWIICPENERNFTATQSATAKPTATPTPKPTNGKVSGVASYYSRSGCLGCSQNLHMANGEPLDDSALTVAFNKAPLNSFVEIFNAVTGKKVVAKVTDTGGFERHGRIVDLTVATRDALGCSHLCLVTITLL